MSQAAAKAPVQVARWRVDGALIFIALIWGSTFVLVKDALANVSTLLFLTLRFALAAAVLLIVLRKQVPVVLRSRNLKGGILAGVCLFSGYVFQTSGLKYTTPSKAAFITGLYIPLVPLIGGIIVRKAPKMREALGVAISFTGMVLLTAQRDLFDIGRGDLLVLGCAFAFAFHIIVLGRFAQTSDIGALAIVQIATCAVLGILTCWTLEPARISFTANVCVALAVTSLLATALAFALQTWAQQYSSPTRTALIFSLEPVFAWATSFVLTGEVLTRRGTFAAILILCGIVLVEWKTGTATAEELV